MRMQKHLEDLGAQVAQLKKEPPQILTSANGSPEHYSSVHHEISALRAQVTDLCAKVESLNKRINHLTATNNAASAKPSYDLPDFNRFTVPPTWFPDYPPLDLFLKEFDGGGSGTGSGVASGSGIGSGSEF
ncbi:bZIP transcription factor 11-like [Neltuma alba]|uniref:bZIP transcription factor 11-like n=1 Tax=Neltuma alba TaxID=207710 RepID=UPI0010A3D37D|nr:bZIP transcription factor 11-like [Prosopis alba]